MEENQLDAPEVLETSATEPEAVETPEETEVDERDAKIAALEEKNKQLFERAKKAEALKKEAPAAVVPALSISDIAALAKVNEEDVERVERFAKSEGVSIREALKNPELKAILDLREEQRNTAAAANIAPSRRGPTKVSDDVLLADAAKGNLPDSDEAIERLIAAKQKANRG